MNVDAKVRERGGGRRHRTRSLSKDGIFNIEASARMGGLERPFAYLARGGEENHSCRLLSRVFCSTPALSLPPLSVPICSSLYEPSHANQSEEESLCVGLGTWL